LERLQPRGFVQLQPESSLEGETEWSFSQTLLREVTYETVLKRERAALHKAAAAWLEEQARRAGRLDEFAGLLGEHAERASELSAAADWYMRAGGRAKEQGAAREAHKFFSRALELLPPIERERRWQALLGREEAAATLQEPEAWRADVAGLLELAQESGDDNRLAEVYQRQSVCVGRTTGDYHEARRAAEEAMLAARRAGNATIEVRALSSIAQTEKRLGDVEAAIRSAEEALARARELGDQATLAVVLYRAAFCYAESGNPVKAIPLQTEQIELDRRLGNRMQEAAGLGNLGNSYMTLGMYRQARAVVERALLLAETLGARSLHAYGLGNLGYIHFLCGDVRPARHIIEQALDEMTATGDVFGRAMTQHMMGEVLEDAGDAAGAGRRFAEAREMLTSIGVIPMAHEASTGLARCALAQAQLEEARRLALEVWDYLKEHGGTGMYYPSHAYQTCADIFDALDDRETSRAVVEAGYREMMAQADRIDDPAWRKSFLTNDPFNRAIMEMYERVVGGR
jgi:tetratricopeptide (TPR) repeat protein